MIRIVIYDDHSQRCESLKALIMLSDNMECVGVFHDCSHVEDDMRSLKPDVVLMDIAMPNADGINGVQRIKKVFPHIRIIMQTVFEDICKSSGGSRRLYFKKCNCGKDHREHQ